MTSPSNSAVQNLLPVQAYFDTQDNFVTFIGQGKPFYASVDPSQSGLNITNSTINSTTIGLTTPAAAAFTNISTVTGTISTAASGPTDIVNKQYVDYFAAGLSWKAPAITATAGNITLSGLQTISGITVAAGDIVLVKNQGTASENGIYVASAGPWTYSIGGDTWSEYIGAIIFISSGSLGGTAWYCTAQPGGTLGVTAMNWSNFSVASSYTAGTGLTLTGTVFSITNTGATAATYGSASRSITQTVNAQGQITNIFDQPIDIAVSQINNLGTGVGTWLVTPTSANLAAAVTDETGSGSLVFATSPTLVTPALGTPTSGNFSTGTFTWPTFNQNTTGYAASLAGGLSGSIPYQTAANTTAMLAKGTDGQILSLASGLPTWINNQVGTVTSIATAGTVNGLTLTGGPITTSGTITLGGTLDLSSPPAIGGTTPAAITGTVITANTQFVSENYYAQSVLGGNLRTSGGTSLLNWDGGGSGNVTINGGLTASPANKNVALSPSGTGTVTISPATAGTMNNVVIGGTTPLAGTFTDFRVNNTISLAGSTGTAGYLIQSNGASAPSWVNPATLTVSAASTATAATNATNTAITDDTTTNATMYPTWVTTTTGNLPQKTSSTKLSFNPSTGTLTATTFSGALSGNATTASSVANALTAGTGLTATATFNGSAAVTFNATGTTINSQTTGYTLVAADAGKTISITTGGVTIPNSVMAAGNIVTIYNNSGSSQTLTQGTGVTLQWAGQSSSTTGNRTLGLYGIATIVYITASNAVITGAGLS